MGRARCEVTEARLEHIDTLERLGRLVLSVARAPVTTWFVRLDALGAAGITVPLPVIRSTAVALEA